MPDRMNEEFLELTDMNQEFMELPRQSEWIRRKSPGIPRIKHI